MIDTTVVGILHCHQPFQVEHHLVQEIGSSIIALRYIGIQLGKVVALLLIDGKHQSNAEC